MKVKQNEALSKYTTIKIGGIAKEMYFPQSIDELKILTEKMDCKYIIGGGSNLLINDEKEFESVICLRDFNNEIKKITECEYCVGAGVRLQTLINTINSDECGGLEYLYSVPGLVGGAICMNAGRGKIYGQTISDYILDVNVLCGDTIITLAKEECGFGHRSSIFKDEGKYIILSARMRFPKQEKQLSEQLKMERIRLCKEKQDNSLPNFGSVFLESSGIIMKMVKLFGIGNENAHFSKKTENWIIKEHNGNFCDVVDTINKVKRLHKILGKKATCEVVIWD